MSQAAEARPDLKAAGARDCSVNNDRPRCPICNLQGVEKKQKWFCPRCGQLIQTCCD